MPENVRGEAVVDGTTAFVLTRRHRLLAVDVDSGRVHWRRDTDGREATTLGERLTLAGDLVIAPDKGLFAFDRSTGVARWRLEADADDYPGIHVGEMARGLLFTGSVKGRVLAVDVRSGLVRWASSVSDRRDVVTFAPVTDGTTVAALFTTPGPPDTGGIVLLDAASGRRLWRSNFPAGAEAWVTTGASVGLVMVDDLVIGVAGDGRIHAYSRADGVLRWSLPSVRTAGRPWALDATHDMRALLVSGRLLIAGSLTGVVTAYDLTTREVAWEYYDKWNGSTMFRLGTSGDLLLLPHFSGHVVALEASTGQERWRKGDFEAGFMWPPVTTGRRLLFTGTEAGVAAFPCVNEEDRE